MTVTVTVTKWTDFTVAVTVHGDVSPSVPGFTFEISNGIKFIVFYLFGNFEILSAFQLE